MLSIYNTKINSMQNNVQAGLADFDGLEAGEDHRSGARARREGRIGGPPGLSPMRPITSAVKIAIKY